MIQSVHAQRRLHVDNLKFSMRGYIGTVRFIILMDVKNTRHVSVLCVNVQIRGVILEMFKTYVHDYMDQKT